MHNIVLCFALFFLSVASAESGNIDTLKSLESAAILFKNDANQVIASKNPNTLYVPASAVKVLTSLISIDHWGLDYRFKTEFYFDTENNSLWIKGYGDPYLISEELDLIVTKLQSTAIQEIDVIGIDSSYFDRSIRIDGKTQTLNPYDATVGALAANFNTINIQVRADSIRSNETQTPLTPLASHLAQGLSIGKHRINLSKAKHAPRYFYELLKAKLNHSALPNDALFLSGEVPQSAVLIFTHRSSMTLEQVIGKMLEYSNNFIANQLFLTLGATVFGAPANLDKSQAVVDRYIHEYFDWSDYMIVEGAGLSRNNRLSAEQLINILEKFRPYRYLMPSKTPNIFAKTGTLEGVSTYAGYIQHNHAWLPFAILINQVVHLHFREEVTNELLNQLPDLH